MTVSERSEALDMTTPSCRALAGMLLVFAAFERDILRDRVRADVVSARKAGTTLGRPVLIQKHLPEIRRLHASGTSKRGIAERLKIARTLVRRLVESSARHRRSGRPRSGKAT